MNRGCPDWPFYGQHGALTSTLSRVSTMYGLRLVVEIRRAGPRRSERIGHATRPRTSALGIVTRVVHHV